MGTTVLGTSPVSGGTASFTTASLPRGSDSVKAVYSGDGNLISSSGTTSEKVRATTTLSLSSNNPTATYGESVTLKATISSAAGTPPDGEKVTFKNNGTVTLGTVALSGGVATLTTSTLPVGTLALTASYPGDVQYLPASASLTETVSKGSTSVTLASSQTGPGQPVTLTATVQPNSGTAVPTGTVSFKEGTKSLGSQTLSGGTASVITPLSAGTHTVQVTYGGSGKLNGSTGTFTISVQ
jgi:hypothetical protein